MFFRKRKVRYAVVGQGHVSQAAVLPAFQSARSNSELAALVSDDPEKLASLGRKYRVRTLCDYGDYDRLMASGLVDAVYIALPNSLHCEYTERAARRGIDVLCEKPMAVTEMECERMIRAARSGGVKLMIAYRLHFEAANLHAVRLARSGKLGELKLFDSVFCMQVKPGDIRLSGDLGGGTLYDIGIYCINAARYLFRDEPEEVFACSVRGRDPRFDEVDQATAAVLRFPDDRLASFATSFGSAEVSSYRLVGTRGDLRVEPAYSMTGELTHHLRLGGKSGRVRVRSFPSRDQFGAELAYFSDCLLKRREPEPSGEEGLADVRVIRALQRSAQTGRPEMLSSLTRGRRSEPAQRIDLTAVEPELVHAGASDR